VSHERWQITSVAVETDGVENPTWDHVRIAIQSLDASQRRSTLMIEAADGTVLLVGGGHGRLTVQLTYPRGAVPEILMLADPSRGTGLEHLTVAGIETPLRARLIVDEAKALQAARMFCEDGVADPELTWEVG
jgi:hypothetical protein